MAGRRDMAPRHHARRRSARRAESERRAFQGHRPDGVSRHRESAFHDSHPAPSAPSTFPRGPASWYSVDGVGDLHRTVGPDETEVAGILQIIRAGRFRVSRTAQERLHDAAHAFLLELVGELIQMCLAAKDQRPSGSIRPGGRRGAPDSSREARQISALLRSHQQVVGYLIAIGLFFVFFLRIKAGSSRTRTGLLIAIGFLVALAHIMFLDFPRGLLQNVVELPWPIG